jgi:acetolactate synthase-1/2/3 large subunit
MNGAQSLVQTLVNGGVNVCFTNPGTSEIHFVAAVDQIAGMRTVLGLFEGVCTGAADGYARMLGKPAATLVHLGPGLGNGLANLHNARRANSPVISIVGEHATYHVQHDAPLTTDIESIARSVSGWVRTSESAAAVPTDGAEAIAAAMAPPGQVATLILPGDCCWNESVAPQPKPELTQPAAVDTKTIEEIAAVLRKGEPTVILLAGPLMLEKGLWLAGRIARASGARIIGQRVNGRSQRGAGRVVISRLPYPVKPALEMLKGTAHLILAGAKPPVSFFAWPNMPNWLTPDGCRIHRLSEVDEDGIGALEALADLIGAPAEPEELYKLDRPPLPTGELTAGKIWQALVALMPEEAIISDEGVTSSRDADKWTTTAPRHDWLNVTGGAIGQGLPVATGAAVACPDRKVFAMEADGSGMYTLQSLWTQAREQLDVVTVIFSNRAYKILLGELKRVGVEEAGPNASAMFSLSKPDINWVKLAEGMGVHGMRAETCEQFNKHLEAAIQSKGPHLIEAVI